MKLLHTADWHLGKTLMNYSLIDDQEFILKEFLKVIDDVKPDAIIIAGDVYDRTAPSTDAVNLFDDIIFKLTERKIPTLCIAGNHDSKERLNFGSRLFANKKFYITAKTCEPENIALEDEFGEVYFSLIPYFTAAEIKNKFALDAENFDTGAATKICVENARQKIPAGKRSVAVAHLFATGGVTSESERKNVGTIESVDARIFSEYNYTALGHLHKPQKISSDKIRYSGSPLKYSVKESSHKKGITLVELDGNGFARAENILLKPQRDLIEVSGTLAEFLSKPANDAYAYVTLTDEIFVYDAAQKLRGVFPHLMEAKNKSRPKSFVEEPTRKFRENATIFEQFEDFFFEMTRRNLTVDEQKAMEEIFREVGA